MKKILTFITLIGSLGLALALIPLSNVNQYPPIETPSFNISGADFRDTLGTSLGSLGDINGDGFDDVIVGAPSATVNGRNCSGAAYVIYGSKAGFSNIDVQNLTTTQGFTIIGGSAGDQLGYSVSSAGDVNGDGIPDIIVGAINANSNDRDYAGAAYVIYGSKSGFQDIDVNSLTNDQGFIVMGASAYDFLGSSVSNAGDFNGDGVGDIIVAASGASPLDRQFAGIAYVIYGNSKGLANIDLSLFTLVDGLKVIGDNEYGVEVVSSVGDINEDGFDDIAIGDSLANSSSAYYAGIAYIIYGSNNKTFDIDLGMLSESEGFTIQTSNMNDYFGSSISNAGDVNGDNITDFIIGAQGAGVAYVLYGSKTGFSNMNLSKFTSSQGFMIIGPSDYYENTFFGVSVSGTGDVNGDGLADVVVGAPCYMDYDGAAYVIFGSKNQASEIYVANLTDAQGFAILGDGNEHLGSAVSGAGDLNDDGFDDVIVGAPSFNNSLFLNPGNGAVYVVFGASSD